MKKIFVVLFIILLGGNLFALPPYSSLCVHLKNVEGWSASECTGMNVKSDAGEMVSASKTYSYGSKNVEVTIVGGINASAYWSPFQMHFQLDTPEEMVRTLNVKGSDIGITYHKKDKSGSIIVPILKKTSTIVNGVLMFNFSNMEWKEALEFSKKFDWEKIKKSF